MVVLAIVYAGLRQGCWLQNLEGDHTWVTLQRFQERGLSKMPAIWLVHFGDNCIGYIFVLNIAVGWKKRLPRRDLDILVRVYAHTTHLTLYVHIMYSCMNFYLKCVLITCCLFFKKILLADYLYSSFLYSAQMTLFVRSVIKPPCLGEMYPSYVLTVTCVEYCGVIFCLLVHLYPQCPVPDTQPTSVNISWMEKWISELNGLQVNFCEDL